MEIQFLAYATIFGIIQLWIAAHGMTAQRGAMWNMGNRDVPGKPLTGIPGRLERAFKNFMETYPFFAAAVLMAVAAGKTGVLTERGVQLYFFSRVVYVGLYVGGIIYLRSAIWIASMVGIGMILYAVL